jgi:hypothetical protein
VFNMLLHQNMIKMGYNADFVKELRNLKAQVVGNGFLRVTHPTGGHDDLYCAVARSLYLSWLYTTKNKGLLSNLGISYKDSRNQDRGLLSAARGQKVFEHFKNLAHNNQNSIRNPRNMFPNKITR